MGWPTWTRRRIGRVFGEVGATHAGVCPLARRGRIVLLFYPIWRGGAMALSIKNPEAESLARELARITGESLTQAVTRAIRDRLVRETARGNDATLREDIRRIQRRVAKLPVLDGRAPEEILGYDADGLPT